MKVRNHVITLNNGIEQQDQVQQRLLQIEILRRKPFATEDDDGPTESIDATLVQTANARHFRQVFSAGPMQQFLVSAEKQRIGIFDQLKNSTPRYMRECDIHLVKIGVRCVSAILTNLTQAKYECDYCQHETQTRQYDAEQSETYEGKCNDAAL